MYCLAIIDNDIGSCIDIQTFQNKSDLYVEIKDILYSVCPGFNDHLEEVLKKFREFKPQEHLDQFKKIDFTKQYWECHFPGNYRYISVHKVDD